MSDAGDAWRAATRPPAWFVLDGDRYELRRRWLAPLTYVAADGDEWCLGFLASACHPGDAAVLLERVMDVDDRLDQGVLYEASSALVRRVTGAPSWTVSRLVDVLRANFGRLDADMVKDGLDMMRLLDRKPWRALALTRDWYMRHAKDEGEAKRWADELDRPPLFALQNDEAAQEAAARQAIAALQGFRG